MKIGYGRDRKLGDFTKHGVDEFDVFIDTSESDRAHREALMQYALHYVESNPDDTLTLVLYSMGELGMGADLAYQKKKLEGMGAVIQVVTAKGSKQPRGRPAGSSEFQPSDQAEALIKSAYHDRGRSPAGVLAVAAQQGHTVTMAQLKGRWGNRFKKQPINWRDDPEAIVEDDGPQIGRDYA